MRAPRRRIKPGWYVLVALSLYAVVATAQWRVAAAAVREARIEAAQGATESAALRLGADALGATGGIAGGAPRASEGLWFPIPGARVPSDDAHLPGAPRPYRAGHAQGFTFWTDTSGVPIVYGTPVVAAGDGVVTRVDEPYVELAEREWQDLIERVADGADERELDMLRGRQVWIRLDDGRELRYGHLSGVRAGLTTGARVTRGRVIGRVGNSGTGDAVAGRTSNARLHFEIWEGDAYFGEGLEPDDLRMAAASLFTGP